MTQKDAHGHIVELQSLRGIAAIAVMIGHCLGYFEPPLGFWRNAYILFNGRAAVAIFFVLSGFVLTRSLARKPLTGPMVLRFYAARAFRIYPAIWSASILGLLYLVFLHWRIPVPGTTEGVQHQFRADRMDLLHIAASMAGMLAFILPQLWSVTVELVASVTMPFVAAVAERGWGALVKLLAVSIVVSFIAAGRVYYNIPMYYVEFVLGAGIAVLPPAWIGLIRRHSRAQATVVVLAGLCLLPTQWLPLDYYSPTANMIEALLASLIITLLAYSNVPIGVLRSRSMLFLGDISYSLYLLHYVVLCTLAKVVTVVLGSGSIDAHRVAVAVSLAILVPLVAIPLAWVNFIVVEMPGVQLGKRFLGQWRPKAGWTPVKL